MEEHRGKYDAVLALDVLEHVQDDVKMLNKYGGHYRLCKGIYVEPEKIAFKGKQEVRDNFMASLKLMFEDGNYVGIATHDKYLIDESYKLIEEMNIPKEKFEFQMLYGIREDLQKELVSDGYQVRVYVPYGSNWFPYYMIRIGEHIPNGLFVAKSLVSRRKK